ncbi:MAG: hypothetical protein JXQ96_20180 [Cyclobacteriaceae bacterium]
MRKIIAISLSILLVVANIGFTVGTHFCLGMAVETKLIIGAGELDCGMNMVKTCETDTAIPTIQKKGCCDNHFVSLQIEDEYNSTSFEFNSDGKFLFTLAFAFFQINYEENADNTSYREYYPPPLNQDVQVLFQSFLI